MNVQLRLTDEMKKAPIEYLGYSNKAYGLLKRLECQNVGDIVEKWRTFAGYKGVGVKTVKEIHNGVVNYMITNLPDNELIEWFKNLINSNSAEDLKTILDGFNAKKEVA